MAEEAKETKETKESKKEGGINIKSLAKIVLGILVILAGVVLTLKFLGALLLIIKGCIGPFLILAGLIIVAIAKE